MPVGAVNPEISGSAPLAILLVWPALAQRANSTNRAILIVGVLGDNAMMERENQVIQALRAARYRLGGLPIWSMHLDRPDEGKFCRERLGIGDDAVLFLGLVEAQNDRPVGILSGVERVQSANSAVTRIVAAISTREPDISDQPVLGGGTAGNLPLSGGMIQTTARIDGRATDAYYMPAEWDVGVGGWKGAMEFDTNRQWNELVADVAVDERAPTGTKATFAVVVTAGQPTVPGSSRRNTGISLACINPPEGIVVASVEKKMGEPPTTIRVPMKGVLRVALWVACKAPKYDRGDQSLAVWIRPRAVTMSGTEGNIGSGRSLSLR